MPKYYCDYCDIYLTHSSPAGRRQHASGRKHINMKVEYFQNLIREPGFQPPTYLAALPSRPIGIPMAPGQNNRMMRAPMMMVSNANAPFNMQQRVMAPLPPNAPHMMTISSMNIRPPPPTGGFMNVGNTPQGAQLVMSNVTHRPSNMSTPMMMNNMCPPPPAPSEPNK